jgi:hypothetical protein
MSLQVPDNRLLHSVTATATNAGDSVHENQKPEDEKKKARKLCSCGLNPYQRRRHGGDRSTISRRIILSQFIIGIMDIHFSYISAIVQKLHLPA